MLTDIRALADHFLMALPNINRTHITGLTQDTVHVSGEFTSAGATHRTHRARPVQRPMLRSVSPKDNALLPQLLQTSTSAIENMRFIFSKALNPASQARWKGERNPNPSLS